MRIDCSSGSAERAAASAAFSLASLSCLYLLKFSVLNSSSDTAEKNDEKSEVKRSEKIKMKNEKEKEII